MDMVIIDYHHKPIYFLNFHTMSYGAVQSKLKSVKDFMFVLKTNRRVRTYMSTVQFMYQTLDLNILQSEYMKCTSSVRMSELTIILTILGESFYPHFF